MTRYRFSAACLLLAFSLLLPTTLARGQEAASPGNRDSMKRFDADAERHTDMLLLKALQFTAPYAGFYQLTSLDGDGNAFSARIVPDWAVQASSGAKLDGALVEWMRQTLAHTNLDYGGPRPEPQDGQLHTAFVFYDGATYRRYDFNGPPPSQVQELLDHVNAELEAEAKRRHEEFLKHNAEMERLYGDWQNRSGVTVVEQNRSRALKGGHGLLLTLTGRRKQTPAAAAAEVAVYHALILYPEGQFTGEGGGGGWGDDPLSTEVVMWGVPKEAGRGGAKAERKTLEIKYHAIDATVGIGGETFQLSEGNMFVIRMGADWTPSVSRVRVRLDEPTPEQSVLERFKSALGDDESVRRLELN